MTSTVGQRVQRVDDRLFGLVARADHGWLDQVIPRVTRAADHGVLWLGVAAVLAASGPTGRRAAARGLGSLGVASALANGPGKWAVRRHRPQLTDVPSLRLLRRQPGTTSFPSGHSASAAAFSVGVFLEAPLAALPVAVLAAGVAYGRVHTGVHHPSDVVAGVALGAASAVAVRRLSVRAPATTAAAAAEPAIAPALPDGDGLVFVVNADAGGADSDEIAGELRRHLPRAEVVSCAAGDDLAATLRSAAARATVLGVAGGDGTVGCAAQAAIEARVPLAVLPAGTLNHFAAELGLVDVAGVVDAVRRGEAAAVSVGTVDDGVVRYFLNTFSLGVYPEVVRRREHLERWLGKWLALAVAMAQVLRHTDPLDVEVNGRRRRVWLLFAGNGRYGPSAFSTAGRARLDGDVLDVRIVDAEHRWARTRVIAAALTGRLQRSGVYGEQVVDELTLAPGSGAALARDGEAEPAPRRFVVRSARRALTVYRPQPR